MSTNSSDDRFAEQLEAQLRDLGMEERWDDAIEFARSAVERFPDSVNLRLGLAEALLDVEDELAAEHFRIAVDLRSPDDGWALVRAGLGMHHLHHADEAFEWCEQAGAIVRQGHPAFPFLMSLQGRLSAWIGEHENAELYLRHATALDPQTQTLWVVLAEFLRFRGDYVGAEEALREALMHGADPRYIHDVRTHQARARYLRSGRRGVGLARQSRRGRDRRPG